MIRGVAEPTNISSLAPPPLSFNKRRQALDDVIEANKHVVLHVINKLPHTLEVFCQSSMNVHSIEIEEEKECFRYNILNYIISFSSIK